MLIDSVKLRKRIILRKEISKKYYHDHTPDLDWVLNVIEEMEQPPEWWKDSAEEIRTV